MTSETTFDHSIKEAVEDLRHHKTGINWIILGFKSKTKNELVVEKTGKGGLEEFKSNIRDDETKYCLIESKVEGDSYNPVKYILVTWIGPDVPAGLAKARFSAQKGSLLSYLQKLIAINSEFQPSVKDQITSEYIAQKISAAAGNTAAKGTSERHQMSRTHQAAGDNSKSKLVIVDSEALRGELRSVYEGKFRWVLISYVPGKKDEVQFVAKGKESLEHLGTHHFQANAINYALYSTRVQLGTEQVDKFIFITLCGPDVPPLQKARSSAQRQDLLDFVLSVVPFHLHFQPTDADDLKEDRILAKILK
eukprot:TRINITY_DN3791_c0_g1_i1.p1 TRINITY_DN3791_c0_g1~~TRINITY_DN3791_c0_g1_i1.p1  ORF type:complete len:323 (+),score=55.18 TRINITY_DN3791_c0_g1_i1:50-970(+)